MTSRRMTLTKTNFGKTNEKDSDCKTGIRTTNNKNNNFVQKNLPFAASGREIFLFNRKCKASENKKINKCE